MIASGKQYSVRAFVEAAARCIDREIRWQGQGVEEKGYDAASGQCLVQIDSKYFRPTEVETLLGNPAKARERLGWQARTGFDELVAEMVAGDIRIAERDALCEREGFRSHRYYE